MAKGCYNNQGKKERGQALVEFAATLPILLIIFFVTIDAILLMIQFFSLNQVAELVASEAAKDGGVTERVEAQFIQQATDRMLDIPSYEVYAATIDDDCSDGICGQLIPITPRRDICQFGEDIVVVLNSPWETLLLGQVLSGVSGTSGMMSVMVNRQCTRGRT